ncbi:MAG: hypothetical protein FGF48_07325 [Candidatus Brockarchaeota archaeon]|nr:hypothetical protein [Candidatus Brockarchaeota archaeon]
MEFEVEELSKYVRSVVEGVSKGIPEDYVLSGGILFKIAVVKERKAEGGFRILVAEAGGNYASESIHTIEFKVLKEPETGIVAGI